MKAVATEVILAVGVLVAVSFTILQLRGVFFAQQELSKEEVVTSFAKDLNSIIDKAIATTGNAAFVYYPPINQYRVEIEGNVVLIFDKISRKTASFSKTIPKIVENRFEDCEKIFVVKQKEKIALMCECLDLGEECTDSLFCCSGYCNTSNKKCEEMPICPEERLCFGAPESKKDVLGKDCCPLDIPICTNGHCCPTDKPKYCKNPLEGEPRCMSDADYKDKTKCKTQNVFHLVIVPLNYDSGDDSNFKILASQAFNQFMTYYPFRECGDKYERVEVHYVDTSVCSDIKCTDGCEECQNKAIECARRAGLLDIAHKITAISKSVVYADGLQLCGCAGGIPALTSVTVAGCIGTNTWPHEVGHSFGLYHVRCRGDEGGACQGPNAADCHDPNYRTDIMSYCQPRDHFGPNGYAYLKSELNQFMEGC